MDIIGLVLAVLKLLNWLTGKIDHEQLKADVRRELIEEETTILHDRLATKKALKEKIDAMPDKDVDAELRGLEPK